MTRINLYQSFVLHQYQFDVWEFEPHNHNFFEIIFIEEGTGYHTINNVRFKYKPKDIFLIAPEDVHNFEIEDRTTFTYFKFTETLFTQNKQLPDRAYWLHRIEHILHNPNLMPGDVINDENDRKLIWQIHEVVLSEYVSDEPYSKNIISNTISTILSLIARNIERSYRKNRTKYTKKSSRIDDVLSYIRTNVYEHELMKTNEIANSFGMSANSINALFKRETGDSIRQYIENYKMQLVQYRLRNTDQTIAEIAYELGFTDESHLTKVFKKHYKITPKVFKKANNAPA